MLRGLAHLRLRPLALLAAVLWTWSAVVGHLHTLRVMHVVCSEHHEVVEVHASGGVGDERPGWYATAADDGHDHGCALQDLPSLAGPKSPCVPGFELRVLVVADPVPPSPPARGPPLEYAPKTSPPSLV